MTDGITNFLRDETRLDQILAAAPDDVHAATDLAHAAMNAGAGDNDVVSRIWVLTR